MEASVKESEGESSLSIEDGFPAPDTHGFGRACPPWHPAP